MAVFEWDETKSHENLFKHGLSFDDAEIVFAGPCVTFEDNRFDYGEPRFITLGHLEGRIVVVAHTPCGVRMRIISMRKGNRREEKADQERLETP